MVSRILAIVALLSLVLPLAGCSSRGGSVTFNSTDGSHTLVQSFNQAYITQNKSGEMDVILVDSATDWDYGQPSKNKPLQPTTLSPIRQVMRIHLYWRPLAGTTKNPAAINSTIDWYVLGPDGSTDMLVYEGAGFITADTSGSKRDVEIRDGRIRLKSRRGNLHDPVGTALITGQVTARTNDIRVKDTVAEIEQQLRTTLTK